MTRKRYKNDVQIDCLMCFAHLAGQVCIDQDNFCDVMRVTHGVDPSACAEAWYECVSPHFSLRRFSVSFADGRRVRPLLPLPVHYS